MADPGEFPIEIATEGGAASARPDAERTIRRLSRFAHKPILYARVTLTQGVSRSPTESAKAAANVDVSGDVLHAQATGSTISEALDLLGDRLEGMIKELAGRRRKGR